MLDVGGTGTVQTGLHGNRATGREATDDDWTRQHPGDAADFGGRTAGEERDDRVAACGRWPSPASARQQTTPSRSPNSPARFRILGMDDSGELPVVELVERSDEPESDDDSAVSYEAGYDSATGTAGNGSNGNGSSATVVYDTEPAYESSRPVTRLEQAPEPLPRRGRDAPPERSEYPRPRRLDERPQRESAVGQATGAESMSPDPIDDGMVIVYQSRPTSPARTPRSPDRTNSASVTSATSGTTRRCRQDCCSAVTRWPTRWPEAADGPPTKTWRRSRVICPRPAR